MDKLQKLQDKAEKKKQREAEQQGKQELKSIPANAISQQSRAEKLAVKGKCQRISKTASHQTFIRLSNRAYEQFVKWKGSWGKGRAFVVSETGASVKNRGAERFLISGDENAVKRAINMIVTQSLTAEASLNDYDISNEEECRSATTAELQWFKGSKVIQNILGL